MKTRILTNSFHNTEIRTRKTDEELDAIAIRISDGTASEAEKQLKRRIQGTLCRDHRNCTCGDDWGRRG